MCSVCACLRAYVCLFVHVHLTASMAKWLEHQPTNLKAVGSMPKDNTLKLLSYSCLPYC